MKFNFVFQTHLKLKMRHCPESDILPENELLSITIKKFEDLTISDDFMFSIIMREPVHCKLLLERILDIKIQKLAYPEYQKNIDLSLDGKGVRLDIYVEDEACTIYDVEMQTTSKKNLPKRTRYYQAMIDLNHLEKGDDYSSLKSTLIIFICLFDPYKLNQCLYTFENTSMKDPNIKMGDDTKKIFVNVKGSQDGLSEELKNLLSYINSGIPSDSFTKSLDDAVKNAKTNTKWRREYMVYSLKLMETFADGREEGRTLGRAEGRAEILITLVKEGIISKKDAVEHSDMELKEFEKVFDSYTK